MVTLEDEGWGGFRHGVVRRQGKSGACWQWTNESTCPPSRFPLLLNTILILNSLHFLLLLHSTTLSCLADKRPDTVPTNTPPPSAACPPPPTSRRHSVTRRSCKPLLLLVVLILSNLLILLIFLIATKPLRRRQ